MYLFEYLGPDPEKDAFWWTDLGLVPYGSVRGTNINSSVLLRPTEGGSGFVLSEFPGNCSSLVLSNIQNKMYFDTGWFLRMLERVKKFAKRNDYAGLFISLTEPLAIEKAEKAGFIKMIQILNPHSGQLNVFLFMDLTQEGEKNESDTEG